MNEEIIKSLTNTADNFGALANYKQYENIFSKLFTNIPDDAKKDFESHFFESAFWKTIETECTPLEVLKKRKGSWNKDKGDFDELEYFPEDYTLGELNRLFPGWWTEDMHSEIDYKLRIATVSGYLCVEYPTLQREKVAKRWAVASSKIQISKEIDEKTNAFEASNADDVYKAARTEWIKVAGKWYGIGLDIYHQKITPELRSIFEDTIRNWGAYGDETKKLAATIIKGVTFRDFIKELPTIQQTKRFLQTLEFIPQEKHHILWLNFVKLSNKDNENKIKTEEWLLKLEKASETIKQKGETK